MSDATPTSSTAYLPLLYTDSLCWPGRSTVLFPKLAEDAAAVQVARRNGDRLILVDADLGADAQWGVLCSVDAWSDQASQCQVRVRGEWPVDLTDVHREGPLWIGRAAGRARLTAAERERALRLLRRLSHGERQVDWPFRERLETPETPDHIVYRLAEHLSMPQGELLGRPTGAALSRVEAAARQAQRRRTKRLRPAVAAVMAPTPPTLADVARAFLKLELPDAVRTAVERELATSGDQRTSLEWLASLMAMPWDDPPRPIPPPAQIRAHLDATHHGLDRVKDAVLDLLAAARRRQRLGDASTPTRRALLLVGPPGVGKTTICESIAQALGGGEGTAWPLQVISLAGVDDDLFLIGCARSYTRSRPGAIARAFRNAASRSTCLVLDEVDKVGTARVRTDDLLLPLLDSASPFTDQYLEAPLDLSRALIIATANSLPGSAPLLDRFEVVQLDGYGEAERLRLTHTHVIPKILRQLNISDGEVEVTDAGIRRIIEPYPLEPGVRQATTRVNAVLSRAVRRLEDGAGSVRMDERLVDDVLGSAPEWRSPVDPTTSTVGRAAAMSFINVGIGFPVSVDVSIDKLLGGRLQTAVLGEADREAADQAHVAVVVARRLLGDEELRAFTFQFGPPSLGLIAGPSCGAAALLATVSALRGVPVRAGVAVSGAVSLRGDLEPVGGIAAKLAGASRAGFTVALLPAANRPDVADLGSDVLGALTVRFMESVADLIELGLSRQPSVPALRHRRRPPTPSATATVRATRERDDG